MMPGKLRNARKRRRGIKLLDEMGEVGEHTHTSSDYRNCPDTSEQNADLTTWLCAASSRLFNHANHFIVQSSNLPLCASSLSRTSRRRHDKISVYSCDTHIRCFSQLRPVQAARTSECDPLSSPCLIFDPQSSEAIDTASQRFQRSPQFRQASKQAAVEYAAHQFWLW